MPRWRKAGHEVIVTADHGQTPRGHHGGSTDEMRDVPFYYFGASKAAPNQSMSCDTVSFGVFAGATSPNHTSVSKSR